MRLRRPNLIGDVILLSGEVVGVDAVSGEARIALSANNQRGELTASGTALVRLPSDE